jgi:hypothetical protein
MVLPAMMMSSAWLLVFFLPIFPPNFIGPLPFFFHSVFLR